MKPGLSTLNPYAAAYIPLSKRDAADEIEVPPRLTTAAAASQAAWYAPADHMTAQNRQQQQQQLQHDKAISFHHHHHHHHQGASAAAVMKGQAGHGGAYQGLSSSGSLNQSEDYEMDLEYLQMMFPGISDESLSDVYMANKGDLEAAIDMLNQLEFDSLESSETLPDTLDIGDVSEPGSSAELPSGKLKNVVGEASASASGSTASESVIVT